VTGSWIDEGQYLQAASAGHVRLRFHADSVYVVAGTAGGDLSASVLIDGAPLGARAGPALLGSTLTVARQDLYQLLQGESSGLHVIDLAVPAGFRIYTFTFG